MTQYRPWPGDPLLIVGDDGSITRDGQSALLGGQAYARVRVAPDCLRGAHVVVCETFHGPMPEPGMEAAHWDGDPSNNQATNLRWATRRGNAADKARHGRQPRGDALPQAKLTDAAVVAIRRRAGRGDSCAAIARDLDISRQRIHMIIQRRAWQHVPPSAEDRVQQDQAPPARR